MPFTEFYKILHPPFLVSHQILFSSHPIPTQGKKSHLRYILAMRSLPLLLLPLLLAAIHSPPRALAARREVLVGGWNSIGNINDPHVQEIAEFAVSEHNRLANTSLALIKVVKGEYQVVAGTNYRLVLETRDGKATANYVAVVFENLHGIKKLTSFTAVKG